MTEISKMFENANIKQDRMCEWTCKDSENCNLNCKHYGSTQLYYPPFTAEKQLTLLRKIVKSYTINISYSIDAYYMKARSKNSKDEYLEVNNYFDEGLASLIIDLWQDLTNQEKEEIRRILNE